MPSASVAIPFVAVQPGRNRSPSFAFASLFTDHRKFTRVLSSRTAAATPVTRSMAS